MLTSINRKLSVFMVLVMVTLMITSFGVVTPVAAAVTGLTDTVLFGNSASEQAHNLTTSGTSSQSSVQSIVGSVDKTYDVRYFEGVNAEISFDVSIDNANVLTLEVQEIHNRQEETFGYSVYVDNTEVYFRSYDEAGSGPNHYFIKVPTSITSGKTSVTVKFKNIGTGRVNFGKVWAYADFDGLMAQENVYRKMKINLFTPGIAWYDYNSEFDYNNYNSDLQILNDLKSTYSKSYTLYDTTIGLGFELFYMRYSQDELEDRIDYLLQLSKDSGMPLYFDFNSWWAGTPWIGPDGYGGHFSDIKYQQVVYDPLVPEYKLSIPNIWANTPWLTMNNDLYNQIRADKLEKITEYISRKTALLKSEGQNIPKVSMFTENEPVYWPDYAFNSSPNSAGDYNSSVISDALNDGITLDPSNGLSLQEKEWLQDNMNSYIHEIGDSIAGGLKRNAVSVDNGTVMLPDYQIKENAYTHMFEGWQHSPLKDEKKGLWETHRLDTLRFGGEYAGVADFRYFDYIAAAGKFTDVNAEHSCIDWDVFPDSYQIGADGVVLFGIRDGFDQNISNSDKSESTSVSPIAYDKIMYEGDFDEASDLNIVDPIQSITNAGRTAVAESWNLTPTSSSNYGEITYKFTNSGQPFSTGLKVGLTGRILSFYNSNCKIEVWAGTTQSNMTFQQTLTELSATVDLSSVALNQNEVYVQLKLYATGLDQGLLNWTSLTKVKAMVPWSKTTGHSDSSTFTIKQTRTQNLWIGYRADAQRLLDEYLTLGTTDSTYNQALTYFNDGKYVSAYNLLNGEISQLLPAKYSVKGYGQLGKYNVSLTLADSSKKLIAELTSYGTNQTDLEFYTEVTQAIQITRSSLQNGDYYKLVDNSNNSFSIVKTTSGDTGAVAVSNGSVTFSNVSISAKADKILPSTVTGLYTGYHKARNAIKVITQDSSVGENAMYTFIPLASNVTIKRGAEGASEQELITVPIECIQGFERVDATIDAQGNASAVKVYYGKETGTLNSVEQVAITGQMSNGSVTFQSSNKYEFKAWTYIDAPSKATGSPFVLPIGGIGLSSGDNVEVIYSAYSYNGSTKGALKISEPYDSVINDDFEDGVDSIWQAKAYEYSNLQAENLDANYKNQVLTTVNKSNSGYVTYKIEDSTAFSDMFVEYSGRAIMDSQNGFDIYVSEDNTNWTKVGDLKTTTENSSHNEIHVLDISSYASGKTTLYVKFNIFSTSYSWGCLNSVKIRNKATIRSLGSATMTVDKNAFYVDETAKLNVNALYSNNDTVYDGDATIIYVSDNESVATVDSDGVITGISNGTADITAYVTKGAEMVATNTITVTVRRINPIVLIDEDYEVTQDSEWQADAYEYSNLQAGALDGNYPQKGLAGINASQVGYVTYKLDSQATSGFMKLGLDYTARGIMGNAYVKVYAGEDTSNMTLVETVTDGDVFTNRHLDLSDIARYKNTIYVKFEVYSYQWNWGYLGNVKFTQTDYPDDYNTIVHVNEDYEVTQDSEWQADAYEYSNLQAGALDGNYPQKGLAGINASQVGYVTYKLDSQATSGFMKLGLDYTARGIMGNAYVKVYAGEDTSNMTLVETVTDGEVFTNRHLDLSDIANHKDTIYVKFEVYSYQWNWGYLGSVKFTQTDYPYDYNTVVHVNEDYEVTQDSEWQADAYAYDNLQAEALDGNYPQKGLAGINKSQVGYVTYQVNSEQAGTVGFEKLKLDYTARGIMGNAYVKVYAGTSTSNVTLVDTVGEDGISWDEIRTVDLTDIALNEDTIYVKFEVYSYQWTWGYLGSVQIREVVYIN